MINEHRLEQSNWWPQESILLPPYHTGLCLVAAGKNPVLIAIADPTCSDAPWFPMPSCWHSPYFADTLTAAPELAQWHTQSAEAISFISCREGK